LRINGKKSEARGTKVRESIYDVWGAHPLRPPATSARFKGGRRGGKDPKKDKVVGGTQMEEGKRRPRFFGGNSLSG